MDERNAPRIVSKDRSHLRLEPNDRDDMAAIRADIQQTRARMSQTVEDIGERLNPERVKQQLKQNLHDATIGKAENMARAAADRVDHTRHNLMDNIRDNPIPAAMVGIGLGWLILNGRRDSPDYYDRSFPAGHVGGYRGALREGMDTGYYRPTAEIDESGTMDRMGERVSEMRESVSDLGSEAIHRGEEITHRMQDRVVEIAHDARDTVSDATDRAQQVFENTASRARSMAGDLAHRTQHGTHRLEHRLEDALQDSPLAVGAAAVALGLAIGLSAPSTRRESRLMGAARDDLVHRAKDAAGEMTDRAQEVAKRAVSEAGSAVREVAEDEGLT
jgi:ElaB/YqjD/DUF883 family membrane-anchored ribosome-binding protein